MLILMEWRILGKIKKSRLSLSKIRLTEEKEEEICTEI